MRAEQRPEQYGLQVGNRTFYVGDGAMATYLHQCGVPIRVCAEELNLSSPGLIEQVHKAYVDAGVSFVQTNTFAANRTSLARYGLSDDVSAVNREAVQIARRAASDKVMVLGTIGPVRGENRYGGRFLSEERLESAEQFREQVEALLYAGVDGFMLETFPDLEELLVALSVVRDQSDKLIVANLSPEAIGVTRDGVPIAEAFEALRGAGADVTGLNCRLGAYGILRTYEELPRLSAELAAIPNGGMLQRTENDALSYTGDEENFAEVMARIARLGVNWLGGCCGTTPNHIRALVQRLQGFEEPMAPRDAKVGAEVQTLPSAIISVSEPELAHEVIRPQGVSIVDQVEQQTTIIVELDPPKNLECERFIQGARALRAAGADMITLADNSLGTVRVSNMALASMLKQFGIEPLVHVTCRDRNLIGQQSHLMGLHVLGIRNILLVTGDPSRYGDLPGATSVYDVSSIDLTKMVRRLNEGVAFSGKALRKPAEFVIGTSFNPHVRNFDKAIDRLKRKIEAGADYVMTQPVFDERIMEQVAVATANLGVPVFIGIMPLTSVRNAEFLHHQVPGITIPEGILQRMRQAPTETVGDTAYEIAQALCDKASEYFRGIYLVTPFLKYEITVRLTQHIREHTTKKVLL